MWHGLERYQHFFSSHKYVLNAYFISFLWNTENMISLYNFYHNPLYNFENTLMYEYWNLAFEGYKKYTFVNLQKANSSAARVILFLPWSIRNAFYTSLAVTKIYVISMQYTLFRCYNQDNFWEIFLVHSEQVVKE